MKIIRLLSKGIVLIALLNIFAFSVRHIILNGEKFGIFTEPFKCFIEFPLQVKNVTNNLTKLPPYHVVVDDNFTKINLLDKDVYALNAHYERNKYVYELSNLKNDSILHSWEFAKEKYIGSSVNFSVSYPQSPILLDDGSIIGMLGESNNLFRLDKSSNITWHIDSRVFHHSINMSHDNHIWACTYRNTITKNEHSTNSISFDDNILTKIDANTGKIVFEKALSDILISNGYMSLVHGCINAEFSKESDFFHLNDIEPINFDGEFWMKGDLLLSLRNRSLIILYRPKTNRILRVISGPFLTQHDVDVISKSEISIFNNNRTGTYKIASEKEVKNSKSTDLVLKSSNVVIYNFSNSSFTMPFINLFESEKIYSCIQGTHTFLKNGDLFVESTETGKIYIFRNNSVIYRKYANKKNDKGTTECPHWMRIYENLDFLNN